MVLEEIMEEESLYKDNQESDTTKDDILESVQTNEGTSSFYLFYE